MPRYQRAEPSVHFYKIVALSFLGVTLLLLGVIMFMSSKRATITIMTKADPVDVTGRISVNSDDQKLRVDGVVTSTFVAITEEFEPTGTKHEEGVAKGTVTIYNESSTDQPLVATTRLLTPEGILFRISERVLVPAKGSVEAPAYADAEGPGGDIQASEFTIPGLSTARQEEVFAKSSEPMTGGLRTVGVLSSNDVEKAKKTLLAKLEEKGKKGLEDAFLGKHVVYHVGQSVVDLVGDAEIGKEVSGFTLEGKATIVIVAYDQEDIIALGSDLLENRAIDDAESIQASEGIPTVSIDSYDLEKATATLNVFYNGVATINAEGKQLEEVVFYGKTKDEVRRYLLSLDHVYGVEVELRPAWTQTVPHVAEHVDIVIKKVD